MYPWNPRKALCSLAGLPVLLLLAGCSLLSVGESDFLEAEDYYKQGDFIRALGLYQSLERRESHADRRDTILFRVGECYMHMGDSSDARMAFIELKEEYPASEYVIDVNNRLADLANRGGQAAASRLKRQDQARQRLAEVRQKLGQGAAADKPPETAQAPLLLQAADELWELERYEDARDAYVTAINLQPTLRYDPKIRGRLLIPSEDDQGKNIVKWLTGQQHEEARLKTSDVIPMTPQGMIRWPGGSPPLVVFNTTMRWERVPGDPRVRYAIVTGQVKNQSRRFVGRSRIEVSLVDLQAQVVDVEYAEIPALEWKDSASFRTQMGPFDSYESITSYACRALINPIEGAPK